MYTVDKMLNLRRDGKVVGKVCKQDGLYACSEVFTSDAEIVLFNVYCDCLSQHEVLELLVAQSLA